MKKNSLSLMLLTCGLLCASTSSAMFSNAGTMKTRQLNINHGHLKNDGTLEGTETANITVKVLSGSGVIKGKTVTVKCDEFKYNGEITAEECTIYTKNAFDYNMFKRNALGKYTIVIAKENGEEKVVLQ